MLKAATNHPAWILGTLAVPFAGLLAFMLLTRGRALDRSERVAAAGGSIFLRPFIMEYAYWFLGPPVRFCTRHRISPNAVTLAGLLVVLAGCVAVGCGYFGLAGPLVLIGSLSDMLDGAVARHLGRSSEAGEFVDAMTDRLADVALLAGLCVYYHGRPAALLLVLSALTGCVLVSYARAKAESLRVYDVPSSAMRRAERTVYLGFAIHLAPVVARILEPGSPAPRYDLVLSVCALISVVCNASWLSMMRFTLRRLRQA